MRHDARDIEDVQKLIRVKACPALPKDTVGALKLNGFALESTHDSAINPVDVFVPLGQNGAFY